MKMGMLTLSDIRKDYYQIDRMTIDGCNWVLFESCRHGGSVVAIAVNTTKRCYCYTWKPLLYVVDNIDDFELYQL